MVRKGGETAGGERLKRGATPPLFSHAPAPLSFTRHTHPHRRSLYPSFLSQVTVILTITAAPTFTPSTRRLTMPVSLVGVAPRNPWGEPVGDDDGGSEGGEGGESGGGSGGGGVGGGEGNGVSGVSSSIGASRGPRGWREVAAAQAAAAAAARAQASGGADAPSTQAAADADATSPIILTLAGASLTIDQWLLPTAYSQGADGWCVSAMDPNCNPYVYYGGGGGGTYYMYDAPM